uniref:Heat shock 70 kDa protein 12A-like n=1 Tax=Pundamilia nyererei TaxID=303518 RepID=A0A3B4H3Y4_9CICH
MANSYIIAIDFGTAYSGYAFSLTKREAETEPRLKYWGRQVALKTPKTPTCILFDEHENFLSFGYEAQSAYFKTRSDESRKKFFFECFKMSLYGKVNDSHKNISIRTLILLTGGALKELHKASGNDFGGQTVDKKFKEFLREIFSDSLWDAYEKEHPAELQKMMYEISVLKESDDDVEISCPYNLGEMAKEKQKMEKFFESLRGVSWNQGAIKISKQKVRSFFAESLNGITKSVREILKKDFKIEYILLVGGYARSLILRQHITNQFGGQYKVLCPSHPQEAIMKGAVLFGRNPALVASRISAFTYGVSLCHRFDESKHKADKRYTNKEGEWCDSIFCILVKENEEVGWDKTSEYSCTPIERDQTAITFAFYRTERKIQGLMYVDEWGVEKIGSIILESPDTARGMNREIKLQIKFGATEMTTTAIDVDSGSTVKIDLDFMAKSIKSFRNNVWQK